MDAEPLIEPERVRNGRSQAQFGEMHGSIAGTDTSVTVSRRRQCASFASSQRSASMAAMQPEPAAVIACR